MQGIDTVVKGSYPSHQMRHCSVLEPQKGWIPLNLRELWEYRELLYFLTWRDVRVRYKQTLLGMGWAILQPLLSMAVFSLFFGKLGKIPSDGIPYPLFSYAALVPWMFFSNALNQSSQSLVGNANLIKKVYFPRLVVPISGVLSGALDFLIAFTLLVGMMFCYRIYPAPIAFLGLGLLFVLTFSLALACGLWLSALNVKYRDVRHVLPFLTQFWLFATPVAYPASLLPETWRTFYALNPMAGIIEGYRWVLFSSGPGPGSMALTSGFVTFVLLATGTLYFRRMERSFADVV